MTIYITLYGLSLDESVTGFLVLNKHYCPWSKVISAPEW